MRRIYVAAFQPDGPGAPITGQALAEDGEGLASDLAASVAGCKAVMGVTSERKHEIYSGHFPEGYELVWVRDPATDRRWQAALQKNRILHGKAGGPANDASRVSPVH